MKAPLLELRALVADYGRVRAVDGVSLSLAAGTALALVGANGAGKSSLLRAVMGLVPIAAGQVLLDGREIGHLAPEARARMGIGYAPEGRRIFAGMTVRDNLEVAARAGAARRRQRLADVYGLFPALAERARVPGWQLSGGQQQMLSVGRALMGAPRLLLLDEPTLGLAPPLAREVMAALRQIAGRGTAVLFAEQNAAPARLAADRACLMRLGRAVAAGEASLLDDRATVAAAFFGG